MLHQLSGSSFKGAVISRDLSLVTNAKYPQAQGMIVLYCMGLTRSQKEGTVARLATSPRVGACVISIFRFHEIEGESLEIIDSDNFRERREWLDIAPGGY